MVYSKYFLFICFFIDIVTYILYTTLNPERAFKRCVGGCNYSNFIITGYLLVFDLGK